MQELLIINSIPASVSFNKDKAISEVKANLTAYYDEQGQFIPLDESKLPDSKKELATLRKVSKAFNDKKIAVKKELSAEIVQFENDVKEVIKVVKDVENEFDTRIKEYETAQKEQRKIEIMNWVEYAIVSPYIAFNDDWLKKSWTDEKMMAEIVQIGADIVLDINTIKMLATSHNLETDKYVEMYKEIDLGAIQHRIIEDMTLVAKVTKVEVVKAVEIDPNANVYTITRTLTGTLQAIELVKNYAESIGVIYGGN